METWSHQLCAVCSDGDSSSSSDEVSDSSTDVGQQQPPAPLTACLAACSESAGSGLHGGLLSADEPGLPAGAPGGPGQVGRPPDTERAAAGQWPAGWGTVDQS